MRIAFDSQIFTDQVYGGISRYCASLAKSLAELEQDVAIFAPFYRNKYLQELPTEIVRGRYIGRSIAKSRSLTRAANRAITSIQLRSWKPDVVHETNYKASNPRKSSATVVTVYDMIHEIKSEYFSKNDKTANLKRKAVGNADHVLCISNNTRDDLIRLYHIPYEKVSVVHLGFEAIAPAEDCHNDDFKVRPSILYVGARGGYKNFFTLLHAVSRSRKLKNDFEIIAFGGGDLNAKEKELINRLGFPSGQVRHVGGNDAKLHQAYRTATMFAYPSLYEGFGIPPLEAMANGCPVVSSNTSSMPEICGDAAMLFNPNSADEMTLALEVVAYSTSDRNDLIRKGKDRVKRFSWAKCATETLAVYRETWQRKFL
jgi:glycosyltransferase involved in cell wall biosynthesis